MLEHLGLKSCCQYNQYRNYRNECEWRQMSFNRNINLPQSGLYLPCQPQCNPKNKTRTKPLHKPINMETNHLWKLCKTSILTSNRNRVIHAAGISQISFTQEGSKGLLSNYFLALVESNNQPWKLRECGIQLQQLTFPEKQNLAQLNQILRRPGRCACITSQLRYSSAPGIKTDLNIR